MTMRVRPADPGDVPALVSLLLQDAETREALNAGLWAIGADAPVRVAMSLQTVSDPLTGPIRHHWLVAEEDENVLAVAHAVNLPPPPIIDLGGGTAGVLLDDCHFADDPEISAALLAATEQVLRAAGAVLFVAASPAGWTSRTRFLEKAGYEPTTLYMAKTGLGSDASIEGARRAEEADLVGIVRLSARHRAQLQRANPIFWHLHPEADARFQAWMRTSLDLPDRSMFVSGPPERIDGYIIAQPASSLHVAPGHDAARIGLIDDFHAEAFEASARNSSDDSRPAALLAAAEKAFHVRGIDTALAICPARMTAKAEALAAQGYRTENLWMVKTESGPAADGSGSLGAEIGADHGPPALAPPLH